jgi:hydrophobic/amphiphilic exporter-1 (mainly G- bacteria), HAE1 family
VIAYREGGPVLVRDVATVIDGYKKAVSFVRNKGRTVMALPARRETGANVITAMANLKQQIEIVNREILASRGMNLELTQVYDETTYIWSSIGLVVKNIVIGGVLAIAVLLLFLRSGSATGIIAVAIPISVVGTMLIIALLGRGLNVVLLAGMAFAVGMVVDNAIVVLENIYRHRSMGKSKGRAALDGAREVWGAVLASTLTTMAVFLPVITIKEEAGQLFKDIAIAISAAVLLSLVVSVLVIPSMAARFFEAKSAGLSGEKPWKFAVWVSALVSAINRRILTRVVTVAGLSLAAIGASYWLLPPAEYLPTGNKNLVFGNLATPPGYSLEEFERMGRVIEDGAPDDPSGGLRIFWEAELGTQQAANLPSLDMTIGRKQDVVRTVQPPPIDNFFYVSFGGGAFMGCTSKVSTNVRPLEDVMTRAGSRIPGVFAMFNQSSLFQTGGRRGGNTLDVEIRGNDLKDVVAAAIAVRGGIMEAGYDYPNATPANFDLGRPEIQLIPDRAKAADLGLDVLDAGFVLRACVDGAFVGEFNDRGQRIDLVLKVAGTEDASLAEIAQLPIYTPVGHVVPVSAAFNFERTTAPQEIVRIEEMSAVTLSLKPKVGVALQETMREIEQDVIAPLRARGAIPDGVITALAGTADRLTETRRELLGDFTGTVRRPTLFGWSVGWSMLSLVCVGVLATLVAGFAAGARTAVWTAFVAGAVLLVGFLAINPELSLMVFQSRALLALLVTYLLMSALFESFAYPFVIMLSVPLAAVGGVAALDIVHAVSLYNPSTPIQQLDVLTMLGFVILIGIVVNNAILIIHQSLNNMREDRLKPAEAVALSVQQRTRPIFMTATTSICGMFPLVVMPGAGSELYRGLGAVVLGGLLISTVFTLVVVPAMFTLFMDFQSWLGVEAGAHESALEEGRRPAPAPVAAARSPEV